MRKRGIAAVPAAFLLAGLFVVSPAWGADEPLAVRLTGIVWTSEKTPSPSLIRTETS